MIERARAAFAADGWRWLGPPEPWLAPAFAIVWTLAALVGGVGPLDARGAAVGAGVCLVAVRVPRLSLPVVAAISTLAAFTLGWVASEHWALGSGWSVVAGLLAVAGIVGAEWVHREAAWLALPPALVLAEMVGGRPSATVAAVGLAAALALALGGATVGPIALVSVAADAVPGLAGPSLLIAAAAILTAALGVELASVAALPGLAALAAAAQEHGNGSWWIAAAAAIVAVIVATHLDVPHSIELHHIPAAALAAWLLIAPSTWAWTGATRLGLYTRAAPVAAAVAALVAVGWASVEHRHLLRSTDPPMARIDGQEPGSVEGAAQG